MSDTTDFTDYAAIAATKKAAALAKKYGIELHIWVWIMNRCEKNLQAAAQRLVSSERRRKVLSGLQHVRS
jgi:ribosomal protein S11